jgi:hypothetical protein
MRMTIVGGAAALVTVLVGSASVNAWGMDVHRMITRHAIDRLPPEIKPLFAGHKEFIAEHSVDPDLWRVMDLKGARGDEPPNHFLDIDFEKGSAPPFANVPRDYDDYVKKLGIGPATRYGRIPWRAEEVYNRLAATMADLGKPNVPFAADNARYLAAVLSHYIEDAHQPFHGALNYDVQMTNQRGIHSRFETQLIMRNLSTWKWVPAPVRAIPDFKAFMFQTIIDSQQLVAPVLAADLAATKGRELYDDGYFGMLMKGAGPIAERRMNEAATAVASAIYSAWIDAGKPALPADGDRPPARIRR